MVLEEEAAQLEAAIKALEVEIGDNKAQRKAVEKGHKEMMKSASAKIGHFSPRCSPNFVRSSTACSLSPRRKGSACGVHKDDAQALRDRCTARSGKLDRARSPLYRSQIWQANMRLKALAEIYTMHYFALLKVQRSAKECKLTL